RLAAAQSLIAADPGRADKGIAAVLAAMRAGEFRRKKAVFGGMASTMLMPVPEKAFAALVPDLDDADAAYRAEVIAVLSRLPVVPQLAKVLREGKTVKARAGAATAIGQTYSKAAVPSLTTALKDGAFEVRYAAAVAL